MSKRSVRRRRRENQRSAAVETRDRALNYREFGLRSQTLNADGRTVDATITTEEPVMMFDYERYEYIPEVLLTEGMQSTRGLQVPLLDSHARYSVTNQLGSVRGITKEGDRTGGTLNFSAAADSEFTKVREGHVTDVSAGYEVLQKKFIPEGKSEVVRGKSFTGPLNLVTKWRLREVSITPIGADEQAKLRGFDPHNLPSPSESFAMNPELRAMLESFGMPKDKTDNEAQAWAVENKSRFKVADDSSGSRSDNDPLAKKLDVIADLLKGRVAGNDGASLTPEKVVELLDKREQERAAKATAFRSEVDASLELAFGESVPAELRDQCRGMTDIAAVRTAINARKKADAEKFSIPGAPHAHIQFGAAQRDKHRAAISSAMLVRTFESSGRLPALDKMLPGGKKAEGWEDFRNCRLLDIARECLVADGFGYHELRRLSPQDLAIAALGFPHKVGLRAAEGAAYHTTGSLSYVTMDAINKVGQAAYAEVPQTWKGPMRQAASVPDFKQKHVVKLSASPNLPVWPDNTNPQPVAFSNEKESYAVEARAEEASISWRLYVNDDMDMLMRIPQMLFAAAARTVNAVAWAQITGNPALSDGQTLFLETPTGNRKRSNYTVGSATPTNAVLAGMKSKMRLMRGLNTPEGNESDDILNIAPRYLAVPTALETTAETLILSIADPASSGNGNVHNPARTLQLVVEPRLDADSATAFYLFADPTQVDTVEVTFLQGQETPVTNDWVDERTMSRIYTIVQSCAAKAIDHRGVQKHKGAA